MENSAAPRVDPVTVIGLGLLFLPLLTMWHEIGGHAATCQALGGHVDTIGAFYVDCSGLSGWREIAVSSAGAAVDGLLAIAAWAVWRRASGDLARLAWWYVAVVKGFVASGYFLFSGVTGFGDFGTDPGGGLASVSNPLIWRIALTIVGGVLYWRLYLLAARTLEEMLGQGMATRSTRRTVAHLFYATLGVGAVLVGVFNPIGFVITAMSAAASSFGGNAGLISVGYATRRTGEPRDFVVGRNWAVFVAGIIASALFAIVLGPSLHFR